MVKCKCTDGILNSGIPVCSDGFGRVKKLVFVPYYDSTNAKNVILDSDILNAAYFEGKVNESDISKRWFPSDEIFNVVDERGDDVLESIEGIDFKIEEGKRVFTGEFVNSFSKSPAYTKFLKSLSCPLVGVFYIDEFGSVIGQGKGDNLEPFLVQRGSVKVKYMPKSYSSVGKNTVSYTLASNSDDTQIKYRETAQDADLLILNGLISVELSSFASTSTTEVGGVALISATTKQGGIGYGAEVANFEVYNSTVGAAVTITSVTESSTVVGGVDFVLDASTVSSSDIITIKSALSGFESNVITLSVL